VEIYSHSWFVTYAIVLQPVAHPFLNLSVYIAMFLEEKFIAMSISQYPLPSTIMFLNVHFTYMWHTIQDIDNNKMIGKIDSRPVLQ